MLTAMHCLGNRFRPEDLPEHVTLQFAGERLEAKRMPVPPAGRGLDVALLKLVAETIPPALSSFDIATIASEVVRSFPRWRAEGFPELGDGSLFPLEGTVRGFIDREGPMIHLNVDGVSNKIIADDSGRTQLSCASGAAVTYNGRAIGIFNDSIVDTQFAFATPMDRIAEAYGEVRAQLRNPLVLSGTKHLTCDRKPQWKALAAELAEPEACGFVLYGHASEEHGMFVNRLRTFLATNPSWGSFVAVDWTDCWSRDDFLGALTNALVKRSEVDRAALPRLLVATTEGIRHVIVHPVLDIATVDSEMREAILEYYSELPDLLKKRSDVAGKGPLFLQPIAWSERKWRVQALKLVEDLKKTWSKLERLPEMLPFTEADLVEWGADSSTIERWNPRTTRTAYSLLKRL